MAGDTVSAAALSLGNDLPIRTKLFRIGLMWIVPVALKAVIELGVPRIVAKAGRGAFLTPREIAAEIPNSTAFTVATISRFLRLLTAYGLFDESVLEETEEAPVERKYALNDVSNLLLDDEEGLSLANMILFLAADVHFSCGKYLSETALDGAPPFTKANGTDIWTYSTQDLKLDGVFNKYMASMSKAMVPDLLKGYQGFKNLQGTLVDVAGGYGRLISMIVDAHPHIKGINFDQPHVIAKAPSYPGVEHVAGDMFESVPAGDIIVLKWILHDWSDKDALVILRNVRKALPDHGKLLIIETVLPPRTHRNEAMQSQLHLDLTMLTINVNGRERTEVEYKEMLAYAGFSNLQVTHTGDCLFSVIEASL